MNKAEQTALEMYPHKVFDNIVGCEVGDSLRAACIVGYHQAEKNTIELACEWMVENLGTYFGHGPVYPKDMINDFRKALEEEK